MNDMRKLMEAVEQLTEGWEPKNIAGAIYYDYCEPGSFIKQAAEASNEPYRAMIYEFGNLTGLYNAEALDGSEIWQKIVDELEHLFTTQPCPEDDWEEEEEAAPVKTTNIFGEANTMGQMSMDDRRAAYDIAKEVASNLKGIDKKEAVALIAQKANINKRYASNLFMNALHDKFAFSSHTDRLAEDDDPALYRSHRETRKITNTLHELMDDGILNPRSVADAALRYMSEADVADMAFSEELLIDGDEDE